MAAKVIELYDYKLLRICEVLRSMGALTNEEGMVVKNFFKSHGLRIAHDADEEALVGKAVKYCREVHSSAWRFRPEERKRLEGRITAWGAAINPSLAVDGMRARQIAGDGNLSLKYLMIILVFHAVRPLPPAKPAAAN